MYGIFNKQSQDQNQPQGTVAPTAQKRFGIMANQDQTSTPQKRIGVNPDTGNVQISQDQNQPEKKNPFDLGKLFGQAIQAVKDPGKTLDLLKKGAKVGVDELKALIVKASESQAELNPIMQAFSQKDIQAIKKEDLSGKMYSKASQQKQAETKGLNPVENFLYGVGEFAPTTLVTLPIGGEGGILAGAESRVAMVSPTLAKVMTAGAENAAQAALIYNPKDHSDGAQLQGFLSDTATNFVFGAAFKVALAPMKYATNALINRLTSRASDKVYQNIVPAILHTADEGQANIASKDFFDVLNGKKSANQFEFFQNPAWKDVVKQYGADPTKFPDTLTVDKPPVNPAQEIAQMKMLPAAELHNTMADMVDMAANDMADGKVKNFSLSTDVVKAVGQEMEKKGYDVNYNDLMTGIQNVANYRRSVNDFQMGVADREISKGIVQHLEDNSLLKPLLMIRKLYSLVQDKPGYTELKVADAYAKWAERNNLGGFDELGDQLRTAGYDIKINEPADIIKFANELPTLADLNKKIELPKEVTTAEVIAGAIKPKTTNIEAPYAITQAELDRLGKPQEDGIKISPEQIVSDRTPLQEKVLNRQSKVSPVEKIKAPIISVPEVITAPINKIATVVNELRLRVVPSTYSDETRTTAGLIREYKAFTANDRVVEHIQNKKLEAQFGKMNQNQHLELIHNYETTGSFGRGLEDYSKYYKDTTDMAHQILQDVYGLEGYVDNYIKRAFTFKDKADEAKFVSGFGKTLASFSTSPLKERKYVTLKDAMDYMTNNNISFNIIESNPEKLRQWTITNARAAQAFADVKKDLKDKDLIRFVKFGERPLPNEEFIHDRWANVMFKGDQGMVTAGRYVAPHEVAVLINNAVSDGLFDISPTMTILRDLNNTMNQFQLGISAFHVATTTAGSLGSEMGLALQEMFGKGQRLSALRRLVKTSTVVAPVVSDYLKGRGFIKQLEGGNADSLVVLNEKINAAGGRLNIENRYRTQATEKLFKALSQGKVLHAGVRLPFAIVEQVSKPIMEEFVPRVKLGRYLAEADSSLARATKNYTVQISKEEERKLLGNIWDKIDDVHGQLVQDNLFWNNMVKDVSNLFFRSFGWTYGTLKVAGTGAKEAVMTPKRIAGGGEVITPAMGVIMGYPIAIAMVGAIMNYINTGQAPKEMMDYYFPRSGDTTPDGRPIRVSVPGYMKDMFSYGRDPVGTLLNKMSPELQTAKELIQNKDYYNVMLINPDDPKAKQAQEMGQYLLSKYEPFSLRSFQQVKTSADNLSGGSSAKALIEGLGGFQVAGSSATESPLERKIKSTYTNQLGVKVLTPDEWKTILLKSAAKKAAMQGDYSKLQQLEMSGVYTSKGYKQITSSIDKQKALGYDAFQEMFSKLSFPAQENIYKGMSDADKAKYAPLMKNPPQ